MARHDRAAPLGCPDQPLSDVTPGRLPATAPGRRALALGAAATLLLGGLHGAAAQGAGTIRGTVTYRERIALPPDAVLEVELLDTSRANAPAEQIATARVPVAQQVPIPFTLPYDPLRIGPAGSYVVRATISLANGEVIFRTDRAVPVLTRGAGEQVQLRLARNPNASLAPAPAPTLASLVGPRWVAEAINGRAVAREVTSDLTFDAEGALYGSGGCNRFRGSYRDAGAAAAADGSLRIEIGEIASTMMACPAPVTDQERRFLAALRQVRRWRLEGEAALLMLPAAEQGAPLLRLRRG